MSKNEPYTRLCGTGWEGARPLVPFAEPVLAFLSDLSTALLHDRAAKAYPDVVTFAFFCRRANVEHLREQCGALDSRLGRGLAFHIAPGNVPINFAYSLVAALLAGNACVVKASSRDFVQTRMVCAAIEELLHDRHSTLAPYVNVVIYPRERHDVTECLSAQCDARIIWGGDETVRRIRTAPLPPRAVEVTFADRYSLLVANAEGVLAMNEKQLTQTAQGFYNDTYLTDQNACTSPQLVYWLGQAQTAAAAQERFWDAVHAYAQPRYPIEPIMAVDKLHTAYETSIALKGVKLNRMADNLIVRMQVQELTPEVMHHRCAGGFFVEYTAETMDALIPVVNTSFQTLSYIGLAPQSLTRFVCENGLYGIDRIAPVGHTMDFSLTWDGYDLIRMLSRQVAAF